MSGWFDCLGNNLGTLDGSPREVGWYFSCDDNHLVSLEGAPDKVDGMFWFNNSRNEYSLRGFTSRLKKKKEKPGEAELILTHHFFTPEVIKKQINKNSYFLYYVSRPWNTPPLRKKQDELTKILIQDELERIDALWSVDGYI